MKPMTRDERIRAVMAEATARANKNRSAYEERQRKGSAGLPPSPGGGRGGRKGGGSIINRSPSRRTTGKHNAH